MPSPGEDREGDCTGQHRRCGREPVAGARCRSAVGRVLVGHQSNRSSAGWPSIEVEVAASSRGHCRRVAGRRADWEGFLEAEPSMLYRCMGGDRGCDGGGR